MSNDEYWQEFLRTGKVSDYLKYAEERKIIDKQ